MSSSNDRQRWFYEDYTPLFIGRVDFQKENQQSLLTDQLGRLFKDFQNEESGSRDILSLLKQRIDDIVQMTHDHQQSISTCLMAKLMGKIIQYKLKISQESHLSKDTQADDFLYQVRQALEK